MGDKIPLRAEQTIKLEGYFDVQKTYSAIKKYLANNRHYDLTEKQFIEKNKGKDRSLEIETLGELMFTDYLKVSVFYNLNVQGEDIEIEIDGKTKKYTKGYAKLKVFGYAEADFLNKRKTSPLMTLLGKLYDKYFSADEMKKIKKRSNDDIDGLIKIFKQQIHGRIY